MRPVEPATGGEILGARRHADKAASLSTQEFEALAAFRMEIRRYLNFAQKAAESCGLTMQQHQAMLAICTARDATLSVGQLAELMFLRHHSTVELTNRLVKAGLVERGSDPEDGRKALLRLTPEGQATLNGLASEHLDEIRERGPQLVDALGRLMSSPATGEGR